MAEHSQLSPSSAYRWTRCPGSIRLIGDIKSEPSMYAEEGSAAHAIAAYCLKTGCVRVQDSSLTFYRSLFSEYKQYIDKSMLLHIQTYLDAIREKERFTIGKPLIEQRVDISWIHPDIFGTVDYACQIANPSRSQKIVQLYDLKYGAGITVEPEENLQLILYALGIVGENNRHGIDQVHLTIVQPRIEHKRSPIRTWAIPIKKLMSYAKSLQRAARDTQKPHAPLSAGQKHCRFCPALMGASQAQPCPEVTLTVLKTARLEFDVDTSIGEILDNAPKELGNPETLSKNDISQILSFLDIYDLWAKKIRAEAIKRLNEGGEIPGFKLVESKGHRKWIHEQTVKDQLSILYGNNIYTIPKLLSPAQMEKITGRELIHNLWSRSSKITIAKEEDKRPAVTSAIVDFKDQSNNPQSKRK